MITRRTKVQLMVFVLITLLGVSFVGARYARLDRLVRDDSYPVVVHLPESGGIFSGAEVDWRGVSVGRVAEMTVSETGVDVRLAIENGFDEIPADTLAVVANRSAVGEQYVDLQPRTATGPFLRRGSEIATADTRTPLATATLLADLSRTVDSVDRSSLRSVVHEFGVAFDGTGEDLGRIIDTSNSFIAAANDNFDVTTSLIRDADTVLRTQVRSGSAIRTFSKNLALFSGTLAASDADLRRVIDSGSATAQQLRSFLEENQVDLAGLINGLVTTGEVVVHRLPGVEQLLVVYPYVVEGGFTVVAKDPVTDLYDAHFGLVLTTDPPVCHRGYESTDTRPPQDGTNRPMNESAHCAEPATQSNARGAQNAPRPAAAYRPPVAGYDAGTGRLTWGDAVPTAPPGHATFAPGTLGAESWKWLFLQPMVPTEETP